MKPLKRGLGIAVVFSTLLRVEAFSAYIDQKVFMDQTRHFSLKSKSTAWEFFAPDDLSSHTTRRDDALQFVARSPEVLDGFQPTLTMRIDRSNYASARAYGERWLKEYPKYGYELQNSKDLQLGKLKGFAIELSSTQSHRVIKQFIVKAAPEFWIFTCTSDPKHFQKIWAECEKILKTSHPI